MTNESISVIGYHVEVLERCGVLGQSGELVTTSGNLPLYISNAADDDLALWVLREMASDDQATGADTAS